MGKGKYLSAEEILREQREIAKKAKQLPIPCSHKKKSGKLAADPEGKNDMYLKCKRCGAKFLSNPISDTQLREAIGIVTGAINQLKIFSDTDKDDNTVVKLGEIAYNVEEIFELYTRFQEKHSKKNKHKHNDDYSRGTGGYGTVSFINDGGKKKKKKDW